MLRYAGIIGGVGYPLFYVIYLQVLHQPYESFTLRLIATLGCAGFALKDRWPAKLQPYYLGYSYAVVLYCLPFFHVFMTLKNHGGIVLISDSFMAVFFLVLLTDWRNTLVMIFVGGGLGTLAYLLTTPNPTIPMDYVERLPTFILVVLGGSLFKFSERRVAKKLEEEKLHAMSTVLGTVAHELRTPLVSISASARGLQRYVTMLVQFYEKHRDIVSKTEEISPNHLAMTVPTVERIQSEAKYINSIIELLLANATGSGRPAAMQQFRIDTVITRTLDHYPFESTKQRDLVTVELPFAFEVNGNEDLFRMVLVNMIRNSLRAIGRARKGTLHIRSEQGADYGRLILTDTGCGIPRSQLPNIFKRFFSYPADNGTGIGLAFCHDTLTAWGGHISCTSEEGKYTEFVIQLPLPGSSHPGATADDHQPTLAEQRRRGLTVNELLDHPETRSTGVITHNAINLH